MASLVTLSSFCLFCSILMAFLVSPKRFGLFTLLILTMVILVTKFDSEHLKVNFKLSNIMLLTMCFCLQVVDKYDVATGAICIKIDAD